MTFSLVMFLTIIVIVSGQTNEQCTRLGNVYDSICPRQKGSSTVVFEQGKPGKRGPAGIKGERGEKGGIGAKGSIGEADYDRVEELISERMQGALQNFTRKLSELSNALTEAKQELQRDRDKASFCPVGYQGKCFWFQMDANRIRFERAVELCSMHGGRPANVYSEFHFDMLLEYLRMFSQTTGYAHGWLGMKYNSATGTVALSDGTPAPYLKWSTGYPNRNNCCGMTMEAKRSRSDPRQHMANAQPSWNPFGVICEK